ncbi:hypothetical protein [Geomicrobium sp. JCM 19039]|uniref:hypothetical protein n=1 Tax=Geomicrobium sp. JCM 19039 TaxID=1460636 RepID=UPI00045F2516|nr:hypothetical protein [Geomicrobium sp. JCM 19039]GAK12693.1 hypothetical protein JCM19039_2486 [Geomicrobium sp. JCM 19039]
MKKKLSFAVTVVTAAVLATSTTIPEVTHGHDQAHDPDLWKVVQPLETVVSFMNTGLIQTMSEARCFRTCHLEMGFERAASSPIVAKAGRMKLEQN